MWDERFEQPGYYYGSEPNDFLKENLRVFKPKGRILCLAEGEGRNAVFLAQQGFQVTAVDGSHAGM
ncbi:MAG: SAM-dependent methyltransferase, partial [Deltaproteobacteria bacterium]